MHTSTILILELILKGTAILLAGCGGAALLARSSSALRSWWWLGVFSTLLLLPLAFAIRPLWTLPVRWDAVSGETMSALPSEVSPGAPHERDERNMQAPIGTEPLPVVESHTAGRPSRLHWSLGSWLLAAYASGALALLAFRLLGTWRLWRLRPGSLAHSEAQPIIDRWCQSLRLRRRVRVYGDVRVAVPMTYGVWQPVILLPEDSRSWAAGELQAALQHEFAHIRHQDAARRWLGTIVTALWWPHPLVWLASRAWKLEQERACDDAVLIDGAEAERYARQLLAAAGRVRISGSPNAAALIMAAPAGLETRLRSIMCERIDRSPVKSGALLRIGLFTMVTTLGGLVFQTGRVAAAPPTAEAGSSAIKQKAEETMIPSFEQLEVTPAIALQALSQATGFKISYVPRADDRANLSLFLKNVPAAKVLVYIAQLAYLNVTYQADGIAVTAGKLPATGSGPLENRARDIGLPKLTFTNATPAEVLKALADASGLKIVYTPAEWDKPNQTLTFQAGAPASAVFFDFAQRTNLHLNYRDDAVYFTANPYAKNGFQTPGTVEYKAETTTIPKIDWKGIKPAEAFQQIAAASGIKIFYTPRPTDQPGLPQTLNNASVSLLLEQVAQRARLRISYEADGVHMIPGNPDLNTEHSAARWRPSLPMPSNPALEASPEFKSMMQKRLEVENAALQERQKKATLVHVGDPAPDFTCRTLAGEEFTLSQMRGKVVILHFFVNNRYAWETLQKFDKEILPRYATRTDVKAMAVFSNLEAPKLEETKRNTLHPLTADPKSEIGSKYSSNYVGTYVIGKDGRIKFIGGASLVLVQVHAPAAAGIPPGVLLDFTPESLQLLNEAVQRELKQQP